MEQALVYAEFESMASHGGSRQLYGQDWKGLLANLYLQKDSIHSFNFTMFAHASSQIVGHITCFHYDQESGIEAQTTKYLQQYLGVRYARPYVINLLRSLVGSSTGRMAHGDFHIGSLAVTPEFRGSGVGTILIGHAEGCARQCGAKGLSLEVSRVNQAAIDRYRLLGI